MSAAQRYCLILSGLLCFPICVHAQSPQQIAQDTFRSTVLLVMEDANGQPISLGSGFFVGPGRVATNLHVIEGASRGFMKRVNQETKYSIEGIAAIDAKRDLAILSVLAEAPPPLPFGNSDAVQVGDAVYVAGNPRGLEGTFSRGIVSGIRTVGGDRLIQITAPISPGSSGGPVMNDLGHVIGVSAATFRGDQNLNFAIPSNYLKTLMGKTGSVKPLLSIGSSRPNGSLLAGMGGKGAESVVGGSFAWNVNSGFKRDLYRNVEYTFSLRNRLREPVRNVYCFVIFYDKKNEPIDVDEVLFEDPIPGGLAKRVIGQKASHSSVKELSTNYRATEYIGDSIIEGGVLEETRVRFRVLDFEFIQ